MQELANYGEYSGAPSEQMTYNYAKTILSLMTRVKNEKGKVRQCVVQHVSQQAVCLKICYLLSAFHFASEVVECPS